MDPRQMLQDEADAKRIEAAWIEKFLSELPPQFSVEAQGVFLDIVKAAVAYWTLEKE